jgi:hypothetical protein
MAPLSLKKEMIGRMGVGGAGGPEFRVLTYACIWTSLLHSEAFFLRDVRVERLKLP